MDRAAVKCPGAGRSRAYPDLRPASGNFHPGRYRQTALTRKMDIRPAATQAAGAEVTVGKAGGSVTLTGGALTVPAVSGTGIGIKWKTQ